MRKTYRNIHEKNNDTPNTRYCCFCAKSEHEVKKLIAGPTVFICDECILLCISIIGAHELSFLREAKHCILQSIKARRKPMDELITDDEFWDLMEEGRIKEQMAEFILCKSTDFTESHHERAHSLTKLSIRAQNEAWKHFYELNPGSDDGNHQFTVSIGQRRVFEITL